MDSQTKGASAPIREGQFAVYMSYGSYRTVRADKVGPKQVRMYTRGTRFDAIPRDQILFVADTREEAQAVEEKLDEARVAWRSERNQIDKAYEEEIAPAKARKVALEEEAARQYLQLRDAIIAKASA